MAEAVSETSVQVRVDAAPRRKWYAFLLCAGPRRSRRVAKLICNSNAHYRRKEYEASLRDALLAVSEANPDSTSHLRALMHLAGAHGAMNKHSEALVVLDDLIERTRRVRGERSVALVPILHARAEMLEHLGGRLEQAAEQLELAREIRREKHGERSAAFATASFNLATVTLRRADDSAACRTDEQRAALMKRASELSLEAVAIDLARRDNDAAATHLEATLDLMAQCADAEATAGPVKVLAARYLEVTGEEWVEAEDDEGSDHAVCTVRVSPTWAVSAARWQTEHCFHLDREQRR